MAYKSRIWGARKKAQSGLESLLEIVGLEVTMKGDNKSWHDWELFAFSLQENLFTENW